MPFIETFRAVVAPGEVVLLESGIEELRSKSAVFQHRLIRLEDRGITFETRFRCALLDLQSRRAAAIPDDVRAKAKAYLL